MLPRPVNNKGKVGDKISVKQLDGKLRKAKIVEIFKSTDDTPQHTSARPIIITSSVTQFHIFRDNQWCKEQVDEVAVQYDDKSTAKVPVDTADIFTLCLIGSIPVRFHW